MLYAFNVTFNPKHQVNAFIHTLAFLLQLIYYIKNN